MARWRKKVMLKDLLGPDGSDTATRAAAAAIAERLAKLPECTNDVELESIYYEFKDIAHADSTGNDVFGGRFTLCDWFNQVMSSLYDWADSERVWIS